MLVLCCYQGTKRPSEVPQTQMAKRARGADGRAQKMANCVQEVAIKRAKAEAVEAEARATVAEAKAAKAQAAALTAAGELAALQAEDACDDDDQVRQVLSFTNSAIMLTIAIHG